MHPAEAPEIDVADVPADAVLLDVREPAEWAAGHVEGSTHIPMQELPDRFAEIPHPPLVVVCRSGHRSAHVAAWLASGGVDAVNLAGGLLAWAAAGRPLVADGAAPPTVL